MAVLPALLSVVIPAYNEERFIATLLARVAAVDVSPLGLRREIIVVDDHSDDRTAELAAAQPGVRVERLPANRGKGYAVRVGISRSTGEYVLIQDADLEYDPQDHIPMLRAALARPGAAVYGSRYLAGGRRPGQYWLAYLGGRSLSLIASWCTGTRLTDSATALKLLPRAALEAIRLDSDGFELDQEITVKLRARDVPILEVPIGYLPRSRADGKKVRVRDWLVGAVTLLRYARG